MKKVGIVTLYDAQNYGAFLQGYAMQKTLQKYGYTPEFIRMESDHLREFYKMVKTKNIPLAIFRVKQFIQFRRSLRYVNIGKKVSEKYDSIVIGSDTLWDVLNNAYPHREEFLGYHLNSKNIFSYAVSCNATKIENFLACYQEKATTKNLKAVGVRDEETKKLAEAMGCDCAKIVLDPTLLLDRDEYTLIKDAKTKDVSNWLLIYGYTFLKEEQDMIKAFASEKKLVTVAIGIWNSWCDKVIASSVPEFLDILNKVPYVCTSTFHGTIFSAIFQKKFVVFSHNNPKTVRVLETLGMKSRDLYCSEERFSDVMECMPPYYEMEKLLEKKRKDSFEFLENALKNAKNV